MIDCIYPLHNRLFYTQMTFPRVLHECITTGSRLWIYDDNSTDGSSEFVKDLIKRSGYKKITYERGKWGNSTYCINRALEQGKQEFMYKVDNDCLIPQGSFNFMIDSIPKECGFLMMRETGDYPAIFSKESKKRTHIGGIGLFKRDAFDHGFIRTNGKFFGFTAYQAGSKFMKCEVDAQNTILDKSPWYSREKEYTAKGWGRSLCNVKSIWDE